MDRAHQWWDNTDARWSSTSFSWSFPSGAILQFGYLEREVDKYRYQSAEFQYVFFDELTQFSESQYVYLFSRLRRLNAQALAKMGINIELPIRMRGATNPGGVGHEWVKKRFIGTKTNPVNDKNRIYIPSRLEDNPSLDQESYERSLMELDPITRAQLRMGDWSADARGGKFKQFWWMLEPKAPRRMQYMLRYWDLAATEAKMGEDPDYTVGTLYGLDKQNKFWVLDINRFRGDPAVVEKQVRHSAERDGVGVDIYMEQEPGSSGKMLISHFARNVLFGYAFRSHRTTGSKEVRANPVAAAAEAGNIHILEAPWNEAWFDELANFPDSAHDDQVDSLSGAHDIITRKLATHNRRKAKQRYGYKR